MNMPSFEAFSDELKKIEKSAAKIINPQAVGNAVKGAVSKGGQLLREGWEEGSHLPGRGWQDNRFCRVP